MFAVQMSPLPLMSIDSATGSTRRISMRWFSSVAKRKCWGI